MLDFDLKPNHEQALSEIPPEYQELFRQTIEQEMAESEKNRTDTDILHYLRGRRDIFKRGGFIRPDGRPGMVTLNPEQLYEQAFPQLAQNSLGDADQVGERRQTLIKVVGFILLASLFAFFAIRSRSQRESASEATAAGTVTPELLREETASPTPPLPEITGADDSLQTIGNLGGALTIGRPSAIEISYSRTEETIALAIDPSQPTPKGEMRYSETTMLSDNPVAVWLFGTVLNYAVGLPDGLVRNLTPGDRITLSTDTGASLRFVVAETRQGTNYEAGRVLSQNRLGLTLFALPASAADDVSFAFANYDVSSEEGQGQPVYTLEEQIPLPGEGRVTITSFSFNQETQGDFRIVVNGVVSNIPDSQTMMLSLAAHNDQTTAVALIPDERGAWQSSFTLPDTVAGRPLLAALRTLPDGHLALVQLGELPQPEAQLVVDIAGASWDAAEAAVSFTAVITHTGEGDIRLGPDFIQIQREGGDVYESSGQTTPSLPRLIHPGETVGVTVTFFHQAPSVRVQIGTDLWAITDIP